MAADKAGSDEDVSTAFQEALLSDWGDGVAEVEEALESAARLSHLHGSGMFFFAQEAGATNAMVRTLSFLYTGDGSSESNSWDAEAFSEPHLLKIIVEVTQKFLESEEREGHLIDPNVWRNATESGGKVALYCTCFAYVVVGMLKTIRSLKSDQFAKHKQKLFPLLCELVRVQSEEIRKLVFEINARQVAPMIGVDMEYALRMSMSSDTTETT